jgi:predicted AlkP superfamily phosphohydrolase/phosphomutase
LWNLRTDTGQSELESPTTQEINGDPLSWCPGNWYKNIWPQMKAFALPSVADGSIRLNVIGREKSGIVKAEDFKMECDNICEAISSLTNPRTGKKIIRDIICVRNNPFEFSSRSPADIIVICHESGPLDVVDSPISDRIGPIPFFRTGSHQAHGEIIENLLLVKNLDDSIGNINSAIANLEDIPATILDLLDVEIPKNFDGISLTHKAVN